ncbi:hypothetical protein RJ640_022567 [Escallonia rubra]|uniref:Fe2OG dioxygenase domain-containing protein n=1 Tax=Escallonia rubra TaxID=112253 RepID=A0AA88QMB1_9ASTE|nr:hypothetical protein RJ640_024867 [Escallonia rubra]KAK2989796.1 hypothetical protein RJ640_022567 [Escallonia rubra]
MENTDAPSFKTVPVIDDIPVIDLSKEINNGGIAGLLGEISNACEKWGVFQVINHGVPLELHAKFELVVKEFFKQPSDEKRKLRKDIDAVNPYDYGYEEFAENVKNWKEVFDFPLEKKRPSCNPKKPRDQIHSWPEFPSEFKEACENYGQEMEKLAYRLLELISLSLGLPKHRLNGFFKDHTSMGRLIHCPPCPQPHLALGTHEHADIGALTILFQDDAGGLEAKRTSDGEWFRVKFVPNAYVVNVGDMLEVWSNKKYVSLVHRAKVTSTRERFSVPFFFNPAYYVVMEPIEELTNEDNPAKYKTFTWEEYYVSRKFANLKNPKKVALRLAHFKVEE